MRPARQNAAAEPRCPHRYGAGTSGRLSEEHDEQSIQLRRQTSRRHRRGDGVGAALIEVLAELGAEHVTVLDVKPPSIALNYLALRRLSDGMLGQIPDGGAIVNTASTAGGQWATHLAPIEEVLSIEDWAAVLDWTDANLEALAAQAYFFSKELMQVYTMRSSRPTIRRGVRTNSVCPSPIDTPLLADFRKTMTDKLIDWNVSETNGRRVTAREVATVLAFLGSDASAYVNGVNLLVDAGFTAAMTTGQVDFAGLA
jgi:Enoyl-(Acyl carrier protein) reductase